MIHLLIAIAWPASAVLISANARRIIALVIMYKTSKTPPPTIDMPGVTVGVRYVLSDEEKNE